MLVGDRLAELLVENGVDRVFGLPGGQTLPLYEGIKKLKGKIEHVLMRDERSAGFAADAYARCTQRVGVCDATVGPGATNLVSPIAEAYCASIPILAIISDIPRGWEYRRNRGNASQAIQQLDIFKGISKWQVSVTDPDALDHIVDSAFHIATSGRPGPVIISVPVDVGLSAITPLQTRSTDFQGASYPRFRMVPAPEDIENGCHAILQAQKPVIVVGGGAHISKAYDAVKVLVEHLKAPLLTTISGKGILSESHPLCFGVVGTFGNPVANEILQEADLIFYVATKIGQLTTLRFEYPRDQTSIVHLDIDPEEIGRNYRRSMPLLGDARLGLEQMNRSLSQSDIQGTWDLLQYREKLNNWYKDKTSIVEQPGEPLKPQSIMAAINDILKADDMIVCDASLASGWASAFLRLQLSGLNFIAPRGLATLGWGSPAAIGAALALPEKKRIIQLAGDGGFAYSVQELETMVRLKLPIVTIIFNNSTLGWIKHIQQNSYQERYISTDFTAVDFATVARGFGAIGITVKSLAAFRAALGQCKELNGPVVIDIESDQWETPVLTYDHYPAKNSGLSDDT